MTTMRERAIEAARIVISDNQDASINYVATAAYDAILTVLMEPSEAMCSAGQWQISDNLTVSVCLENNAKAKKVFQAMLKAATAQ